MAPLPAAPGSLGGRRLAAAHLSKCCWREQPSQSGGQGLSFAEGRADRCFLSLQSTLHTFYSVKQTLQCFPALQAWELLPVALHGTTLVVRRCESLWLYLL